MPQCIQCNREVGKFTFCPDCGELNEKGTMVDMLGHEIKVRDYLNEVENEDSNTDTCG